MIRTATRSRRRPWFGFAALTAAMYVGGASAAAADPDIAAGEHWLKLACAECHTLGKIIDGKGAPLLDGVVGRKAASTDYDYSDAMKAAAMAGLVWTPDNLDKFLADPRKFLPGTGMEIYGLIHESDRQNVIAVLEQYSLDHQP